MSLNALKEYQKARDIAQAGYAKFKDPRLAQALGEALYYLGENEAALAIFRNIWRNSRKEARRLSHSPLRRALCAHGDFTMQTSLSAPPCSITPAMPDGGHALAG